MRAAVWRRPGAERVVTPLELFFDLVYVFAIGELSHHLLEHVDVRTGLETTVLTFAVVYAWYMTAWGANWLEPDRLPVRLMLIALMFASLLMSAGIGEAFGDRAWLFVSGYLVLQLGRATFLIFALRGRPLGQHFVNVLIWELAAGTLLVAGAVADSDTRLWLWAIAVLVSYGGVQVLHWLPGRGQWVDLQHTEISGSHLLERLRLFFLIALGETVLTMGTAFTDEPFALERLAALAISFTGSVAIWWCYFQAIEGSITHAAEEADDAGTIGWWGTLTLTLGVLALIAIAVGNEMAIAHPGDDATLGFAILAFGGPALFLLAQLVLLRESLGQVPRSRVLGALVLAALAVLVAAAPASMIAGIAARVDGFFERHGGKAVFFGRFTGFFRATVPFVAGSTGMALRRLVTFSALSALIWTATFVVIGYAFSGSVADAGETATRIALAGVLLAIGGFTLRSWLTGTRAHGDASR